MAFPDAVEQWRPYQDQFSGDVPTDWALDWMRTESGGNRCNVTTSAGFPEVGLFQLDPGNAVMAGTSQDQILSGCQSGRDVGTDADRQFAVSSGVDYIKALKAMAHAKLKNAGTDWDESTADFWSLVRLQFSAGLGAVDTWLAAATNSLGRGPQNWDEFVSASGASGNHWISVAELNGLLAAGFVGSPLGSVTTGDLVLAGIAVVLGIVGAYYLQKRLFVAHAP